MILGKIKKFFYIQGGNSGLTEEFIYLNQPKRSQEGVDIYSSSTQENTSLKNIDINVNNINNKKIRLFSGTGIIIARNGKAGRMTYIDNKIYTMNDHAYIIQVREEYEKKIDLKYALYAFKNEIERCITSDKGGNRTFNKTLFEETIVEIPDIIEQRQLIQEYEELSKLKEIVQSKINKIDDILNTIPNCNIGDMYKIEDVFDIVSEDRRLTEEYIYNHRGRYPVYSAQIYGAYGYIDNYNYDGDILSVVQYGDSGKTVLRSGKLSIGRNACGLVPKESYKLKVSLRYLKYALQSVFVNNAKGSDLKSLSQETIRSTYFFLPDYITQLEIANEYEKLEILQEKFNKINNIINKILQE